MKLKFIAALAVLIALMGCATPRTPEQQVMLMSDTYLCEDMSTGPLTELRKAEITKRGVNCKKIRQKAEAARETQGREAIKSTSDFNLCKYRHEDDVKMFDPEIKRRKLDCYKILSLYYQRMNAEGTKAAAQALERAGSSETICRAYTNSVRCHTY